MKKVILLVFSFLSMVYSYAQTNIKKVEYFIDADLGVGLNTVVDVVAGTDIVEAILTTIPSSISIGNHKLYFRTKDANNKWSQTTRKNIEIVKPQTQNNVLKGEYFLDADPSIGLGVLFEINPETTDISQAFLAQIPSNTPIGYHKLYGRVKDSYGNWSLTFRKNIQIIENENSNIIALEYFFGSDLGFGSNTSVSVNTPEVDGTRNFYVPYPAGPYNFNDALFVRAKESSNKWSHTTILDELDTSLSLLKINETNTINVFPNPVSDVLNISSTQNFIIKYIAVFDITGKIVFISVANNNRINLNHLKNGMYILNIKTDIGTANYKLIKQ